MNVFSLSADSSKRNSTLEIICTRKYQPAEANCHPLMTFDYQNWVSVKFLPVPYIPLGWF